MHVLTVRTEAILPVGEVELQSFHVAVILFVMVLLYYFVHIEYIVRVRNLVI